MKSKLQNPKSKNNVRVILLSLFILAGFSSVAWADIYAAEGREIEIKIPSRDISVERYYISSAKDPQKILRFGRLDKKDKDTRQAKVDTRKWEPGLYQVVHERGRVKQTEDLFIAPPVNYGSNKLSSVLRQALYFADQQDSESLKYFAKSRGLPIREDALLVDVELKINKEGRSRIIGLINGSGGIFRFDSGAFMRAEVPVSVLNNLVADNDLLFVYPIEPGDFDEVISQGVADTKANLWHVAGFDGKGIRVAIVDGGFQNYKQSIATGDLPVNVTTKSFGGNFENGTHGTSCSEIVYDMAPSAQIYLVEQNSDDVAGFKNIINYLINEKVDVVSHSMSEYRGPYNGTSVYAQEINKARDAGIIWVNANGNRAQTHWEGYFNDNGNNAHVWSGNSTKMKVDPTGVEFRFAWNDWGKNADGEYTGNAHGQDYALNVYKNGILVVSADTNQMNNPNADPFEKIKFYDMAANDIIEVEIIAKNNTGSGDYFELFSHSSSNFEYQKPESSNSIGSDADGAIGVGAIDVASHKLMSYSSRGPTNGINSGPPDNTSLVKPDVSGPTNVMTSVDNNFGGTSAATPHIAGAAAIVLQALKEGKIQAEGQSNPEKVRDYLGKHVDLLGYPPPKNNQVGSGLVVLNDPAVISGIEIPEADFIDYISPSALPKGGTGSVYIYGKDLSNLTKVDPGEGIEIISMECPLSLFSFCKELGAIHFKITENTQIGERYLTFSDKSGKIDKVTFEVMGAEVSYIDFAGTAPIKNVGWSGEIKVLKKGKDFLMLNYQKNKPVDINFGEGIEVKKIKDAVWFDNVPVDIAIEPDAIPGPRTVTITNHDGTKIIGKNAFMVLPPPKVSFIVPSNGKQGKTIMAKMFFENLLKAYQAFSLSQVDFGKGILPVEGAVGGPGYKKVSIKINENAETGIRPMSLFGEAFGTFEVLPMPPPFIYSVYSLDLPLLGKNPLGWEGWLRINVADVAAGALIDLGEGIETIEHDYSGLSNEVNSHFKVKVKINSNTSIGEKNLILTNPDGQKATKEKALSVFTISKIIPEGLPPGSIGALITIEGQGGGFQKGCWVEIEDAFVWDTTFIDENKLQQKVNIGYNAIPGPKKVRLRPSLGTSYSPVAEFEGLFKVLSKEEIKPIIASISPSVLSQGDSLSFSVGLDKPGFSKDIAPTLNISGISVIGDPMISDDLKKATFQIQVDPQLQVYGGLTDVKIKIGEKEIVGEKMLTIKNPSLVSVTPVQAKQGETIEIEVAGEGTHFGPNTQVNITSHWEGEDLPPEGWVGDISTASNVQVLSPTKVKATFKIADDAHLSKRNVGVSTPDINGTGKGEVLWLNESFEIQPK